MKKIDFHGMTRLELEREVDQIVGEVRLNNVSEDYELITGEGPLKEYLKKYLKEEYDLDYRETHNCSGVMFVTVE